MPTVTNLGEIGAAGPTNSGVLKPWALTVERDGAPWNLDGYSNPTLEVWELRTRAAVAVNGIVTIDGDQVANTGVISYAPGASDPLYASSGVFEARLWFTGAGDPEPSGLFRFSIGAGPNA